MEDHGTDRIAEEERCKYIDGRGALETAAPVLPSTDGGEHLPADVYHGGHRRGGQGAGGGCAGRAGGGGLAELADPGDHPGLCPGLLHPDGPEIRRGRVREAAAGHHQCHRPGRCVRGVADADQRSGSGSGGVSAPDAPGNPSDFHGVSAYPVRGAAGGHGVQPGGGYPAGPGQWQEAPDRHGDRLSDQYRAGHPVRHGLRLGRAGGGSRHIDRAVLFGCLLYPAYPQD